MLPRTARYWLVWSVLAGVGLTLLFLSALTFYQIWGKEKAFAFGRANFDQGYYVRDPKLGWRLKPNLRVVSQKNGEVLFQTDGDGFRHSVAPPPAGGAMLLGDSFVQGYYLPESGTVSARLSKNIGKFVYNFGVGGYSTDQELLLLQEVLGRYRADWVVVLFFINDLPYLAQSQAWGMEKPYFELKDGEVQWDKFHGVALQQELPSAALAEMKRDYQTDYWGLYRDTFRRNLFGFKHSMVALFGGVSPFMVPLELGSPSYYSSEAILDPAWKIVFQYFKKMKELAEKQGSQLMVVYVPEMEQLKQQNVFLRKPQGRFLQWCSAEHIICTDPTEASIRQQKDRDLYFRDEGHFSAAGADFMAKLIADEITRQRLAGSGGLNGNIVMNGDRNLSSLKGD